MLLNKLYVSQNMKRIFFTGFLSLMSLSLLSQTSKIENTQVKVSTSIDTMFVNYDLTGKRNASNIKLEVIDQSNRNIFPKNIFGDVGNNIKPGKGKSIVWDMNADGLNLSGSSLKVKVTGSVFIPAQKRKFGYPGYM